METSKAMQLYPPGIPRPAAKTWYPQQKIHPKKNLLAQVLSKLFPFGWVQQHFFEFEVRVPDCVEQHADPAHSFGRLHVRKAESTPQLTRRGGLDFYSFPPRFEPDSPNAGCMGQPVLQHRHAVARHLRSEGEERDFEGLHLDVVLEAMAMNGLLNGWSIKA